MPRHDHECPTCERCLIYPKTCQRCGYGMEGREIRTDGGNGDGPRLRGPTGRLHLPHWRKDCWHGRPSACCTLCRLRLWTYPIRRAVRGVLP